MKRFIIAFVVFLVSGNLFAQKERDQTSITTSEISKSLNVTVGYVPKPEYNALKVSVDYNNFIFNRFGVYTSFEKGLDSGYFTNIYGITGTLGKRIYLFSGVDLFTKYGLFDAKKNCRKDIGIGVIPLKNFVVKAGWSTTVGITMEIGWRISL